MTEDIKVLCVDDEVNVLRSLKRMFIDEDMELFTALSGEEGLATLDEEPDIQVVVSDYRMPGMNGVEFLKAVYEKKPETIRIVLSGYADTASVVAAINEGQIYKFIPKPWNDDELKMNIQKAVDTFFLQKKNAELTGKLLASNDELAFLNRKLERLVEERNREIFFQDMVMARGQFVLDALPVGVIGADLDNVVVETNKKIPEILGMERKQISGVKLDALGVEGLTEIAAKVETDSVIIEEVQVNNEAFIVKAVKAMNEERFEGAIFVFEEK